MVDMKIPRAQDPEDALALQEEIFRAWFELEEVLNKLEDLGQDPHLTRHVGLAEIHGVSGRVRWSETAERWVRA
jgi:hypothetical protein